MSSSNRSQASSPRSSPAPQSSLMLTPTSRVRALLAAFDDSDDEEQTSLSLTKVKSPTMTRPQIPDYEVEFENSDGEKVEGEETRAGPKSPNWHEDTRNSLSEDEEEETAGIDAYARLQRQLISKKPVRSSPPPALASASDSGSDSDSLPKLQRQLVAKRLARSSPAPADDSDSDSLPKPRRQLFTKNASKSDPAPGGESDSDSLFVSNRPTRSDPAPAATSDSDSLPDNVANPRFQALVAKKRAERLAKEQEAKEREAKGKERVKEREAKVAEAYKDVFSSEMNDGMEEEDRQALAKRSRPSARKATKKAQEDMQRQIQRDLRNQQLAHEAKTKKRITTKDLFKVFNFMQDPAPMTKETPPSSPPPLHPDGADKPELKLGTFMAKPKKRVPVIPKPRFDDSDDELEIVPKRKSRFAVFDRTPEKSTSNGQSFLLLRALARVNSPSKSKLSGRNSMNAVELQNRLQDRMRIQALAEKQERLDELKARGIVIQTKEEREHDQLQVENMLERARDEAQALAMKERKAANKDGKDGDVERDILSDDDSEDEDWQAENEDVEIELSGSEEEDGNDEAEADDEADEEETAEAEINSFVDGEASEEEEEEAQPDDLGDVDLANELEIDEVLPAKPRSKARARHVITDDEDDEERVLPVPSANLSQPSQDDKLAAFGFEIPQSSMGLTQMFRGTMDDLQTQDAIAPNTVPSASLDFLRDIPAPTLPELSLGDTQPVLVQNSQLEAPQTQVTERPIVFQTPVKTLTRPSQFAVGSAVSTTRLSEVPEPTQDAGFEDLSVPGGTVETIMLAVPESPALAKKSKRLRRRAEAVAVLSEDEDEEAKVDVDSASEDDEFAPRKDAFDILFKAAKKTPVVDTFDKKRSDAKKMVEEQAEESEDEYAGLGGADDDASDGEMEEELKQMIDEGHVDVDETKLAKFYADRDRAEDEKRIDKLYKDITTGGLRRKRGADLDDLGDDSDDEAQERRRRKQREFAKMRKALLEDENIGKIAENPKKLAFLRAIEDRDEEDALDYFDEVEIAEPDSIPDSQVEHEEANSQEQESGAAINITSATKRKLPADFEASQGKENVAPTNPRRRPVDETSKRAKTLAEIREAVSFLIDEPSVPDSHMSESEAGSEYEEGGDEQISDNDEGDSLEIPTTRLQHRRPVLQTARPSIINRLSTNYSHAEDETPSGPLAFHAPATGASNGGFKVPSLLRRATTNLSTTSNTSTGTTTPTGGEGGVRRGGSKKSNIHYQAREAERRKVLDASETRRRESVKKSVLTKGRQSVLGSFGKVSGFE
ncbi:hypothetical protein FKW77_009669 [Venturia effusa]|uniref:DNA replication checkpoint mediator MRC1 domain-containing protein n=1 Tax=Venturia effusa TaxID=50376 RepID=A0A517KXE3_9PEZI|nr:hypothetical protein FKW77_009669 [Venturia effusa]